MSERPTPETNEAQFGTGRVSVEFARRLERERDEAREALRDLAEQLTSRTSSPDPDTAWWNLKQAHQRALELLEAAK